ncbi:MAG: DUF4105 domain-containing protein [Polyangiales bacterium]
MKLGWLGWLLLVSLMCGCRAAPPSTTPVGFSPADADHTRIADVLIELAKQRGLAHSPGWLKLVHYKKHPVTRRYASDADGMDFFLARSGKFDPQAELEATLRAFLSPATSASDADQDAHPACRFPARTLFLMAQLGLDPSWLGVSHCPAFNGYVGELRPTGASLIFSSYYLNNPSSAFGHTFLRIHKESYAVGERRELLDYGIDFSADVTTSNPVAYTVAGLTGLFHGTFKRLPYYYKVREYNDVESRDLWEYELELTGPQLLLLVAHLWEVGKTYFDYFYLGENCSYAILSVVDAARPETDLMRDVSSPVVPAATLEILASRKELVRSVHYRPSLRTQFNAKVASLERAEAALVEELSVDPELPIALSPERAILVLDAAADLIDILHEREMLKHRSESPAARRKQRLLERRALLRIPSPEVVVPTDLTNAPERGHGARRLGLLGGRDAGNNAYVGLDFRLALHDLADASYGFPDGAQIEFLRGQLRLGEVKDRFKVRLDRVDLVRVLSLSSMERFQKHVSFQVALGLMGVVESKTRTRTAGHALFGGGLARGFLGNALFLWAMADAQLLIGLPFSDSERGDKTPLRIGAGPSGGLRARLHPRLILLGTGSYYWYPAQLPDARYQVDATLRWQFVRNLALSAEGRLHRYGLEAQGALFWYFQ